MGLGRQGAALAPPLPQLIHKRSAYGEALRHLGNSLALIAGLNHPFP
jgi:hypothetical protein